MKNQLIITAFAAFLVGISNISAQTVNKSTTTTTTEQAAQQKPVGDQATMDTKSGKKARKAEKKLSKGKEHKALKKQAKADDKEAVGR